MYDHFVGSVALDSPEEFFSTAGPLLSEHLKRIPDGEPGGRRLWTTFIASECGISRGRRPADAIEFIRTYAEAAKDNVVTSA